MVFNIRISSGSYHPARCLGLHTKLSVTEGSVREAWPPGVTQRTTHVTRPSLVLKWARVDSPGRKEVIQGDQNQTEAYVLLSAPSLGDMGGVPFMSQLSLPWSRH
jgi:hypothetical protein